MIVVTTPTGHIGKHLVDHLIQTDAHVRIVARNVSKISPEVLSRVEIVEGSHGDRSTVEKALNGAKALFWLAPPNSRAASLDAVYSDFTRPACDAIVANGVKHVVSVSALGRTSPLAKNAGLVTACLEMDDLLAGTGAAFRSLALPSFMDNMIWQAKSIKISQVFRLPIRGDLALPTCATIDIAERAAELLLDLSWSGRADVPVLGPADLTYDEMALTISEVVGFPVRYEEISLDDYRAGVEKQGMSPAVVQGLVDMFDAKNKGIDVVEPRKAEDSTATTFRMWCEKYLKPAVESV